MSRTKLLILLLIIIGIFIIGAIILIIDRSELPQKSKPAEVNSLKETADSYYYTNQDQSNLYAQAKIDKIKKSNNQVFAEITIITGKKAIKLDVVLFNKKLFPALIIKSSTEKAKSFGDV